MSDKMREAFEKWALTECFDLTSVGGFYSDNETHTAYIAWQAAQSAAVPVVGDVVAWRWIRLSTGGPDGGRFFDGTPSDSAIETAANSYIPCAPQLLVVQPTTSITAAELDLMRQWFECVQDVNGGFLNPDDFILAKKLYEIIGMRVPHSIIDAAIAGENHG